MCPMSSICYHYSQLMDFIDLFFLSFFFFPFFFLGGGGGEEVVFLFFLYITDSYPNVSCFLLLAKLVIKLAVKINYQFFKRD